MTKRRNTGLALIAALLMVAYMLPEIAQAQTASATGTWKWTQQFGGRGGGRRGGGPGGAPGGGAPGAGAPATQPNAGAARGPGAGAPGGGAPGGGRGAGGTELTLALTQEGEKLSGTVMGVNFQAPEEKTAIKEGSIKADGTLEFKVTTTGQFGEITRVYKGKLAGDTITGTQEFNFPAGGPGGPGGGAGPGAGRGPGGGAPGAGAPASQPGGGAARGPGAGGPGGGAPGGGRGFGGPQEWVATRQK